MQGQAVLTLLRPHRPSKPTLFRLKPAPPPPPSQSSTAAPRTKPSSPHPPAPRAWNPSYLTGLPAAPRCEHPYHLSCLARVRARLHPPNCALCRQPWPEREDASLSHACNQRHQSVPRLRSRNCTAPGLRPRRGETHHGAGSRRGRVLAPPRAAI